MAFGSSLGLWLTRKKEPAWKRRNHRPNMGDECQERFAIFAVYAWRPDWWTPRNEALVDAVVKQARTTRHPWLVACDANMDSKKFRRNACSFSRQKQGFPLVGSQAHIASKSFQGKTKSMEVVEDVKSRPHKAVSFLVEGETRSLRKRGS